MYHPMNMFLLSQFLYNRKLSDSNMIEKKRQKQKIVWFNPPFLMNVKTSVGQGFLKLVKKHFPKNMLEVSHSCMCNIASVISSYN